MKEQASNHNQAQPPWARYLISLAPLSSTSSSFHHAGPVCGCSEHVHLEVEHAEIAASDHTDTMLMAVTQSAGHVWNLGMCLARFRLRECELPLTNMEVENNLL